jgi:hypothetical protein
VLRPAVQQQQRGAGSGLGHVEARAPKLDVPVLDVRERRQG